MNSLPRGIETSAELEPTAPFAREAGVPYPPETTADPYLAWLALMEVVEALCPQWPERERSSYQDCRL